MLIVYISRCFRISLYCSSLSCIYTFIADALQIVESTTDPCIIPSTTRIRSTHPFDDFHHPMGHSDLRPGKYIAPFLHHDLLCNALCPTKRFQPGCGNKHRDAKGIYIRRRGSGNIVCRQQQFRGRIHSGSKDMEIGRRGKFEVT